MLSMSRSLLRCVLSIDYFASQWYINLKNSWGMLAKPDAVVLARRFHHGKRPCCSFLRVGVSAWWRCDALFCVAVVLHGVIRVDCIVLSGFMDKLVDVTD